MSEKQATSWKNYTPWKSSENKKYDQTQAKNRRPIQKPKLPTSLCSCCGGQHWSTNCFYKNKTCNECGKIGHKFTHCRNKGNKNRVSQARSNIKTEKDRQKYVTVHILDKKKMDLQLDSGLDLSIINQHKWKKLKKPMMRKTNKTSRAVTGDKMKFEGELTLPVMLNGTTKKVKVFVHKQSENLFRMDWMERFKL